MNLGLQEIGKGLINLANFLMVLFLINNYLQKDHYSLTVAILTVLGCVGLYISAYRLINKGAKKWKQ